MRLLLGVAALSGLVFSGAAAADPAAEAFAAAAAKGKPGVTVKRQKPCGTPENVHFCGTFGVSIYPQPNKGSIVTPSFKIKADKGATVMLSWTGSVYCQLTFGPPYGDTTDFIVSGQIQRGEPAAIPYNAEGVAALGGVTRNYGNRNDTNPGPIEMFPVTLTRTFTVKNSNPVNYFAKFDVEIRNYRGLCNVNGGAMTAVIID